MDGDLSSDKTMLIERILAAPHPNIPPCSERQAQGPRSGVFLSAADCVDARTPP
jgi:hypothetical protein